mmetsp:Transcript_4754/g.19426  ORF Transcript_4754/g.19426 Transcript_4754/m.19426 type:complete len:215 (+) Transcript_4754:261-905(+)
MVFVSCDRSNSDGSRFGTKNTPARSVIEIPASSNVPLPRNTVEKFTSGSSLPVATRVRFRGKEYTAIFFVSSSCFPSRATKNVVVLGSYATPSSPLLCLTGSSSRALSWYASPVGWNVRASYTMTRCPGIGSVISASWLTATREAFRNVTPSESHADASMVSFFVNVHPDVEANGSYRTSIEGLLTTATRVPSFGSTDTPLRLSSTSLSTCLPQ